MKKLHTYFSFFLLMIFLLPTASVANTAMMEEVYTQLKIAIGDTERTWPKLEIRMGASSVLAYNKRKNIIFIDEKALEICQSFAGQEKDAFAFLLAHEMTHFYQEHHWQEAGFATSFLTNKHNFETHVADEKEADLFGTFVTHLAGYQSIKIIPTLFDKVYEAYGLSADLSDYPSLSQRKATALEVCEKVQELIRVFETANYLTAIGEYTAAAATYEYVLQFVKYKELYNNIGATLVAAAALQAEYGSLAFHYPIELDLEIPLRDGADAAKNELLQKAIEYLTKASKLDSRHYAIFINLVCAYSLKKDYDQANNLLLQLASIVQVPQQKAELAILKGILKAQQNPEDKQGALVLIREALEYNPNGSIQRLVEYNSDLISNDSPRPNNTTTQLQFQRSSEKIEGIDLTYQNDFPFQEMTIQDQFSYEEKNLDFYQKNKTNLIHLQTTDKIIALLITSNPKELSVKNLGIGSTFQQIESIYPTTKPKIINHSKGYFAVFTQHKLLFNLNNQNQVTEWGTYEIY